MSLTNYAEKLFRTAGLIDQPMSYEEEIEIDDPDAMDLEFEEYDDE